MNNIKNLRKNAGYTQEALAEVLGVTQGNMSAWETGRWQPDIGAINQMCDLFGCTSDFLLGRDVPPTTESERNSVNNIYFHLAKEMEEMQLPEADVAKILEFARYMKEKNDKIGK